MKKERFAVLAMLMSFLIIIIPAFGHHGVAAYDMTTKIALKGAMASFEWANPHALINFDVQNDKGETEKWTAETASPAILVRAGWNEHSLKPGDRITVIGYRAKNGAHSMILQHLVVPNGKELGNLIP